MIAVNAKCLGVLLFYTIYQASYFTLIIGQTCHNAYECALTEISTSSDDIECYGFHSCTQASKIESTLSAYIYCYGSYSCYQASYIAHESSSSSYYRHIYCRDYHHVHLSHQFLMTTDLRIVKQNRHVLDQQFY